jgi:Na+/proline symporter
MHRPYFPGMITGTLVTIFWKLFLKEPTGLYELIPAFFLSALVIVMVSLLTGEKSTNG